MNLHELVNRMELCASLKECLSDTIPTLATKDFMLINKNLPSLAEILPHLSFAR